MPRQLFTPGKDPVPIVQEARWDPGPVCTGAENLAPPGFNPQTVQPISSRYTDYATQPRYFIDRAEIKLPNFLNKNNWNKL
jgi:hypothetical protein